MFLECHFVNYIGKCRIDSQSAILVMYRKTHEHVARQSTDGKSFFFFTSLRSVLVFLLSLLPSLPFLSQEHVTRFRFLFSTGVRWDPVSKLYLLCMHTYVCIAITQ